MRPRVHFLPKVKTSPRVSQDIRTNRNFSLSLSYLLLPSYRRQKLRTNCMLLCESDSECWRLFERKEVELCLIMKTALFYFQRADSLLCP